MRAGPLAELIKKRKKERMNFTDEESAQIMRCLFNALEYLHTNNIVHRDLKPGKNSLLTNFTCRQYLGWQRE